VFRIKRFLRKNENTGNPEKNQGEKKSVNEKGGGNKTKEAFEVLKVSNKGPPSSRKKPWGVPKNGEKKD